MPLLSDRIRDRIPWLQLAIESVHVALSVLLALTLNACDHAQEPKRVHRALQGLREELTGMKEILRVGIPHHTALIDTMPSDSLSFERPLSCASSPRTTKPDKQRSRLGPPT